MSESENLRVPEIEFSLETPVLICCEETNLVRMRTTIAKS